MEIKYKDITVTRPREKQTIYSYLKMNKYSENYLKNLRKEFGYIKLNGENCFINAIVKENDIISINVNPNTKTSIYSCIVPLNIVYEDDDVLVVNKPSNMPSMPSKSHFSFNLSGAILAYMEKKDPNFVVRIINRLDKEASGLVLVAKNSLASNFLNEENNTSKTYYALCEGNLPDNENIVIDKKIETLINKDGYNFQKRTVSSSGKSAKTFVEVVKNLSGYCLVKIKLQHGRTHQIRVHMSSIGHPLLGDCLYGTKSELINHTALLCKELRFIHPTNKESIFLTVPFPDDFNDLISRN